VAPRRPIARRVSCYPVSILNDHVDRPVAMQRVFL
jgi:hypothetical protein